jgi:hypothetical protein
MMHNRLHVSEGNRKIGLRTTANVSLLPGVTCGEKVPCIGVCYARKALRNKEVITAWTENTLLAMNDLELFKELLVEWLDKHPLVSFFRWHVAGDVPSAAYANMMVSIAWRFPKVNFLVFTKRYEIDWVDEEGRLPSNLMVLWSAWPGWAFPNEGERVASGARGIAWLEGDERIPEGRVLVRVAGLAGLRGVLC